MCGIRPQSLQDSQRILRVADPGLRAQAAKTSFYRCSKREDSGSGVIPFMCHGLGRPGVSRWIVLLKTIMASIGSPTDEAPLQPEIHSIVSLATAHTQKVYFSGTARYRGPGAPEYRHLWVQLTGTIISVGQQGEKVSLPSVNVADAVRPPFYLRYLCDSAKPSSLVHRCPRRR